MCCHFPRAYVEQPTQASLGWLVGGGSDPESASVLASYQKRVAEAVAQYEENVWRELDPEVASALTQTEGEVKRLGGVLQVRDTPRCSGEAVAMMWAGGRY